MVGKNIVQLILISFSFLKKKRRRKKIESATPNSKTDFDQTVCFYNDSKAKNYAKGIALQILFPWIGGYTNIQSRNNRV
jgi:hypothetical protein